MFLNIKQLTEEIKREIKKFLYNLTLPPKTTGKRITKKIN